jgi:hypothetical protein
MSGISSVSPISIPQLSAIVCGIAFDLIRGCRKRHGELADSLIGKGVVHLRRRCRAFSLLSDVVAE